MGFPSASLQATARGRSTLSELPPSLREPDLGVTYESTGITDPAAQKTEAVAVLSALLKSKPELRKSFHGMWAYASNAGKVTPVMELPMGQIPQREGEKGTGSRQIAQKPGSP